MKKQPKEILCSVCRKECATEKLSQFIIHLPQGAKRQLTQVCEKCADEINGHIVDISRREFKTPNQ